MIEDMSARKLNPHTQRSHISNCKRFAAYLKTVGKCTAPHPTPSASSGTWISPSPRRGKGESDETVF
jgi:hypothetical protein